MTPQRPTAAAQMADFVKANIPLFEPFAAPNGEPDTHDEWRRLNEPEGK